MSLKYGWCYFPSVRMEIECNYSLFSVRTNIDSAAGATLLSTVLAHTGIRTNQLNQTDPNANPNPNPNPNHTKH